MPSLTPDAKYSSDQRGNSQVLGRHHAVKQRDADLEPLRHAYAHADGVEIKAKAKVCMNGAIRLGLICCGST